jgi:acyl-CoA thioester hydrolase
MRPKRPSLATQPVLSSSKGHSTPRSFTWPVRVYYEDTDLGGVVYYANYLKFMERARTEWLRALGFEQTALAREHGVVFVVSSLTIEYLRPAAFNDELTVTVELEKLGAGQIILRQGVARGAEQLVAASVRIGCVNTSTFRPVRIPEPVVTKIGNSA